MSPQFIFSTIVALVVGAAALRYLRRRSVPRHSPEEADSLIRSGQAVFLDVRTESEQRSEHIKGAVLIPLHTLRRRAGELKKYSNREIICYCLNGNRSLRAAALLRRKGLRASSLEGGMGDWNYYRHIRH